MKNLILPFKITLLTLGLVLVLYAMYILNNKGLSNTTKQVFGLSATEESAAPIQSEQRRAKIINDEACGVESEDSTSCDTE